METATTMKEERSSPARDADSTPPPSSEKPAAEDTDTTAVTKEASLEVIKRKLSAAGLIDIEV